MRDLSIGQDEVRYYLNAACFHRNRFCCGDLFRPPDLTLYELAGISDQLGNRAAAIIDGCCGFGTDGDDPDHADQLRGTGNYLKPVGTGSRGSYYRVLLQYGGIRRGKLSGE